MDTTTSTAPRAWIYELVLGVLLLGMIVITIKSCNDQRDIRENNVAFINAISDSMRFYKNKDSNYVATISAMQDGNLKEFLSINSRDSNITKLQKVVKDYQDKLIAGSSVTNFGDQTNVNHTGTTIIGKSDTIIKDNKVFIYPTYYDSLKNEWISYDAHMSNTISGFNLKINNRYAVIVGSDKGKAFVDVINYNPYSSVQSLRTYQVSLPQPKKFGLGIQSGIGFGNELKPTPYIGIGLSYNLINF